ncbi:MAG: putative lipoprotein [Ramlibacter sp.]|nr:putative lipoprotein [Ramlibacter sp.]
MKLASVLLLPVFLAACAGAGVHAPARYHLLEGTAPAAHMTRTAHPGATLLVAPTTASSFYEAQAIVYSGSPGTRSYYQLNRWTEPPSRRLGALLAERLARSGGFDLVAFTGEGVKGTLVLSTHLEEMYHDATSGPGFARISLTAVLSDPGQHIVARRRTFTATVPVTTRNAAGAVEGINAATGNVLDQVVAWVSGESLLAASH